MLDFARLVVFPALMAFAASSDLLTMTISNRVSVLLVIGFGVLAAATAMPAGAVLDHIGAGAAVLAVGFVFFARGWVGGADVKLAAATALWLGWSDLYDYLLCASLLGGWLTLALVEFRQCALPPILAGPGLDRAPAPDRWRRSLRRGARGGGAPDLPLDTMDGAARLMSAGPTPRFSAIRIRLINHELTFGCSDAAVRRSVPSRDVESKAYGRVSSQSDCGGRSIG
jgi:prepilin peptidase CpaA